MELKRDSRIVRWAYWEWFNHRPPARTTLCAIFWRALVLTPLQGLLVVVSAPIWIPVWVYDRYAFKPLTRWRTRRNQARWERERARYEARRNAPPPTPQPSAWRVLWEGAKAVKSKVCPFVTIQE